MKMNDPPTDNCRYRGAAKCIAIKRGVAALRFRFQDVKRPGHFRIDNSNVGPRASAQRAAIVQAKNARVFGRTYSAEPLERYHTLVNQPFHSQTHCRL